MAGEPGTPADHGRRRIPRRRVWLLRELLTCGNERKRPMLSCAHYGAEAGFPCAYPTRVTRRKPIEETQCEVGALFFNRACACLLAKGLGGCYARSLTPRRQRHASTQPNTRRAKRGARTANVHNALDSGVLPCDRTPTRPDDAHKHPSAQPATILPASRCPSPRRPEHGGARTARRQPRSPPTRASSLHRPLVDNATSSPSLSFPST